jgi:cation transport regulator ChaB
MYQTIEDLPEHVRKTMPREAQETYLNAFQRSWRQYEAYMGGDAGQHAVAHRDAMLAVNHHFEKGVNGRYYPTGQVPGEHQETADEEPQGIIEKMVALTQKE